MKCVTYDLSRIATVPLLVHPLRMHACTRRFVAFLIAFHRLGKAVQDFWPRVSCGLLQYDMSRSQSIMRIASTASPVSGAEVRLKMIELAEESRKVWSYHVLEHFARVVKARRVAKLEREVGRLQTELSMERQASAVRRGASSGGMRRSETM